MANYPYGFNATTYQPQPYFQQPYQPQPYQQFQPQQAAQPKTNKVFVTSLDDALSRVCEPNSEMLYLHQDEPGKPAPLFLTFLHKRLDSGEIV